MMAFNYQRIAGSFVCSFFAADFFLAASLVAAVPFFMCAFNLATECFVSLLCSLTSLIAA